MSGRAAKGGPHWEGRRAAEALCYWLQRDPEEVKCLVLDRCRSGRYSEWTT